MTVTGMHRIQLLPESVKSKISAGEVVEGPFSVLKELVENSLDAGASRVEVQVLEAGMKRLSVSDNGCGMLRDDAPLALQDHATSKIRDVHDIESISTYGFRGEALSSIASISDVTLLSRHDSEDMGVRIFSSGDDMQVSDYAGPTGCTIITENLFYNVPARKKFLKSPRTELRYLREAFLKMAVANPSVHFILEVDQKRSLNIPQAKDLPERLRQVYGDETAEGCYIEELKDLKAGIYGMLSRPDYLKSSRTMQQLFINGRPVEYRYLGYLLSKAYEAVAQHGRYPVAILFLEIDPTLVDVNIHPAKREVKLFDSRYIDSLIMQLAGKALNKIHRIEKQLSPLENGENSEVSSLREEILPGLSGGEGPAEPQSQAVPGHRAEKEFFTPDQGASSIREMASLYGDLVIRRDYTVMGVAFATYLVIQKQEQLYFIDFHAAHERFIYDSLIAAQTRPEMQELMFPVMMELPVDEFHVIVDNAGIFSEIGFDIEEFSDNTITIRAVPALVGRLNEKDFIREVVDAIKQERQLSGRQKAIAASAACHSAKRAGDSLSSGDINRIVDKVFSGEHELRCPHGRPFVHVIKKEDLERIFKR